MLCTCLAQILEEAVEERPTDDTGRPPDGTERLRRASNGRRRRLKERAR